MASISEEIRKFENGELNCKDEQIRQVSDWISRHLTNVADLTNIINQQLLYLEFPKILEQVADSLREIGLFQEKETFECTLLLARRGWCIPASFDLSNIKYFASEVPKEDLDDAFLDYFCSEFEDSGQQYLDIVKNELLENKQLDEWNPLLVSTLKCVNETDFYIVIPSLLSILEGLSWKKFYGGENMKWKLTAQFERLDGYEKKDETTPCLATYSVVEFMKVVFEKGSFSRVPRPERFDIINRDWVMHGVDSPKKWNFSDAVRLVNALHALVSMNILEFDYEDIVDDPGA